MTINAHNFIKFHAWANSHVNFPYPVTGPFIEKKNKKIFNIFAENIDCGYKLEQPQYYLAKTVRTCAHNLCFGSKIRKIGKFLVYNIGVQWGILFMGMFS